jgi:hypothetical protein
MRSVPFLRQSTNLPLSRQLRPEVCPHLGDITDPPAARRRGRSTPGPKTSLTVLRRPPRGKTLASPNVSRAADPLRSGIQTA